VYNEPGEADILANWFIFSATRRMQQVEIK
jgi:hypothetical protein